MKVAVIGSRGIRNADLSKYIPEEAELIISGGAAGIDTLAEEYAFKRGIKTLIFKPNYELYGKTAPLIRNKLIVDSADLVIALWDGVSRGTQHTVSYAQRQGVPVRLYIL